MQSAVSAKNRSDDRVVSRIPRSNRLIIEKAAAVYGASLNQFIVQTALDRASEILEREELLKLSARDSELFLDALDNPPPLSKRLAEAIQSHKSKVKC